MARYNSVNSTGSVAGGNSITTPYSGLLTTLTGSGTVTVPNPVYYTGQIQTFYNSTLSAITLSTPSGNFIAPGFTSAGTISIASVAIITIVSDGTNYLVQDWLGGIGSFTSLSASGGTVTLSGTTTGSIDNVIIGGTTAKAATFNGLTNTAGTTSLAGGSASGVFTFSSSQASTAYNNGAVVISTGGLGVAGDTYHNGILVVGTYGTPTTGAGWRTNSTDIYGQTAATDKVRISITGDSWINAGKNVGIGTTTPRSVLNISDGPLTIDVDSTTTSSSKMNAGATNNVIYVRAPFNSNPASTSGVNAKWGILFSGGPSADNTNYPVQPTSLTISKAAAIYAVSEDTLGYNRQVGLAFYTSGADLNQAERIRIASNGNVGIGTNNPSGYNLTVVGTIGSTGNIYSSTSDIRLKDIVKPIVNAIDIVKSIETFYYRNNELALSLGLKGTELQVGISAQSALKTMPEVTAPAPLDSNYLTVMYERIVPFLIEAVKDQQKDIDSLKEQINYLQGKQ